MTSDVFVLNLRLDDAKKMAADEEPRYLDDDGISRDDNEDIEDGFKSSVNATATKSTTSSTRTPLRSSAQNSSA